MSQHPIMHTVCESLMILIFELFGTAMLSMLYLATGGGLAMFVGFFILLILSARISGSHYNPVVTFAFMLRKDAGQFNKWLGIAYMVFQVGGAFLGALAANYFFECKDVVLTVNNHFTECMFSETLGAFILVVVYLTQTEKNYKLSTDAAITLMVISASYCIGMALSHPAATWTQSPLNPAIALAQITFATFNGNIDLMNWAWIYLVFSWLGSLLAVLMFECGFKRAANIVDEAEGKKEEREEEEIVASEIVSETA